MMPQCAKSRIRPAWRSRWRNNCSKAKDSQRPIRMLHDVVRIRFIDDLAKLVIRLLPPALKIVAFIPD